ncbi:DUF3857 domain-containing protein [Aurantiacibacter sp. MUD61]|uniref:DUF3857 domain-containing protein n=1 Tax=Aurantiacibacter sp. MUD61 TaxID=3009083 RepID=UPI0022F0CEA6|nr:DUF3857 domain-containing protein [Aurantiacibacter sp. MUD61]
MTSHRNPFRPALCAVLLSTSAPVFAQDDTVLTGPMPDWVVETEALDVPDDASGLAFLRRQHSEIHLDGDEQWSFVHNHIRLLHPNALQLGNIALTWNPAAGSPTVHRLRIIRDGEVMDLLPTSEFEILRREDQLEAARLDGLLTATLRVPDLRVGDDLEFAYTVPTANPTLTDRDFGALFMSADPSPGRVLLRLSWDEEDDRPTTRMTPDLEPFAQRDRRSITIQADNPEALAPPRDAPPRFQIQRFMQFSDFESWESVSSRFHALFEEARELPTASPLAEEAARIARNHDGQMAQARAALDLVTQQVRYIYVGLDTGAFTPATAEETWERRWGDCKGKTALLLSLLDELGIPAEAVLVSNAGIDDGLQDFLPNPAMFDHVLVRATIDGQTYWMDGTLPGVAVPTERPILPYRNVLPLRDGGTDPETVPWQPLDAPSETSIFDIDASAGFEVPANIVQTTIVRGIEGLGQYAAFSALTAPQLENAFRNQLAGTTQWDTVDTVTWRYDRDEQASVLRITGTGRPDWDSESGGRYDMALPGGGFSPPSRRQRDEGQDQDAPYFNQNNWSCHVTTVRIPDETEPGNWRYNSTFDTNLYGRNYRRMFGLEDRAIRLIRISQITEREIDRDRAERDNERLPDFDNSMGRIFYDPGSNDLGSSWSNRISVPAASEVEWVSDYAACHPDWGYDN